MPPTLYRDTGYTLRHLIDAFNRGLADSLAGTPDLLLDVAGLACAGCEQDGNDEECN